jgi:hypothetical protein
MFILGGGKPAPYVILNSVRANGTSAYLQKTLTTSTITSGSVWVKRAKLGAVSPVFDSKIYFTSGDALYAFGLTSTALYRDPTAWYHIFWNGTGVYVNGTLVTGSGAYTPASITNPRLGYDGTNYFSGYFSDFAFWNGASTSLAGGASYATGVWAARKPYAGYSFLAFGSSGALGTDTSGNGNAWIANGFAATDQMADTPTNNYPTLSAIDKHSSITLSNGNLTGSAPLVHCGVRATMQLPSTGAWYFELTAGCGTSTNVGIAIGICTGGAALTGLGGDANSRMLYASNVGYLWTGSANISGGGVFVVGDVLQCAYDAANSQAWVGKNNTWYNAAFGISAAPAIGGSGTFPGLLPGQFFCLADSAASTSTANFGQTPFSYTPPAGFKALCSGNLTSTAMTTSGTFAGNASADGPVIPANGGPASLTINGNAVTFGIHADKIAGGFKLRTASASYNTSGSNTWTATAGNRFLDQFGNQNNAQGNP